MPELVVIAEQLLAPVPGGTGRYTGELLRALAATAPPGWELSTVVARHAEVAAARIEGVPGPRRLALPRRALAAAWQAGVPLWPGGDAVHAPTPLAPPRVPRGRTLSVTVHDGVPWSHPHTLTPRGVAWHRTMITRAARRAGTLVVPTAAVAAELAAVAPGPAAVRVIGHGVAGVFTEPERVPPPPDLPERFLLAIGTLEPRKGIDVLIDALSRFDGPPLLLAGPPGWGGTDPLALAAAHGLSAGRVRVLGRLGDAELAAVLRRAELLVLPSLAEGFGLPLLEAMAAGVSVVHSDVPALTEVAGGAGVPVPRGDPAALARALGRVLGSVDERRRLRVAGLARAAAFSWQRAATEVWALHTVCDR